MAIRISGVKSSRLSEDQKELIVGCATKYTGDLELRIARECIEDLVRELARTLPALQPQARDASVPTPTAVPMVAANAPPNAAAPLANNNNPDEVRFEMPRNCTITADTSGRGVVLVILNHRLERQVGYAFTPDAARQMAGGLTKSADTLLAAKTTKS